MSNPSVDNLLSRLAGGDDVGDDGAWAAVAARAPDHETPKNEATRNWKRSASKSSTICWAASPS